MIDRYALLTEFEEELSAITSEQEKLYKREQALRKAVAGIRELISLNGGTAPATEPAKPAIADNAFTNMSIRDAAISYLRTTGEPQTNRQITDALKDGGIKTISGDFSSTV